MAETEGSALEQLRDVVGTLRGTLYQLAGIAASLPVPAGEELEVDGEGEEGGFPAEARAAIDCVLVDHLRPAIESLAALSRSGRARRRPRL